MKCSGFIIRSGEVIGYIFIKNLSLPLTATVVNFFPLRIEIARILILVKFLPLLLLASSCVAVR